MPNLNIRHNHQGIQRTYPLDSHRQCTSKNRTMRLPNGCEAQCTDEMIKEAFAYIQLPLEYYTGSIVFKNTLKQLAESWYIRKYKNVYTDGKQRYVFYHRCKGLADNTYTKGIYEHLMAYLPKPNACQACGTEIPKGVLMAVKLQKANIRL